MPYKICGTSTGKKSGLSLEKRDRWQLYVDSGPQDGLQPMAFSAGRRLAVIHGAYWRNWGLKDSSGIWQV